MPFMKIRPVVAALAFLLAGAASSAAAVGIGEIIDERVENLKGDPVGYVQEFIVDVNAGRVLCMVVRGSDEHYTLPLRAIRRVSPHEEPQVDTSLRGPDVSSDVDLDARFAAPGVSSVKRSRCPTPISTPRYTICTSNPKPGSSHR
jgi:hypothetical protein